MRPRRRTSPPLRVLDAAFDFAMGAALIAAAVMIAAVALYGLARLAGLVP